MYDYSMSGFGMGLGWLIPLLFIAALVYFIAGNKKENSSAKDILDKRYANGEIDEQEYNIKKKHIEE